MPSKFDCCGKGGCNRTLPASAFYSEKRTKRGVMSVCKECYKTRNKTHNKSPQPQPSYEIKRRSLKKNYQKRLEWEREYRKRPEVRAKRQAYLEANREKQHAQKSRRRSRAKAKMGPEDRSHSLEYRKAIKNDPCFYCHKRRAVMHTDHKFPLSKGGTDHWWNLCRACENCNERKLARCITKFLLLTTDICETKPLD